MSCRRFLGHPRRFLTILVVLVFASIAPAGDDQTWTPDDIITAESAGSWVISRDGERVAWTKTTIESISDLEKRVSRLWLTRLADNHTIQLTRGDESVGSPRFSPDGARIAFITSRQRPGGGKGGSDEASSQIWIIPVDGGEAWPVTKLDRGVRSYAWADDETFIVLAQESATLWESQKKKKKDTAYAVEDAEREPPVRIFRVSVEGGSVERITDNADWIGSMSVSPDGAWAVVSAQQSLSYQFDERTPPHTRLVNLATGEATRLYEGTRLVPSGVTWTPTSDGFYFVNSYSSHPQYTSASIGQVHHHDLASGRMVQVDLDWERGVGRGLATTNDGFIAMLADGAWNQPARFTREGDGWRRENISGTHARHLDSMTLGHDGATLIYGHSTGNTPRQYFAATLADSGITAERQITELNPGYADKPTGRVEVITWKGYNGVEIEGILSWPLDHEEGTRYPLLLNPHGGPAGTSRDTWSQSYGSPRLLWRQAGAFVLEPNYHGSASYGLPFVESIGNGNYYELERVDLTNGVDHLIERGLVDPERLGVVGWSNGGILAADMITQSTRWKVASIGAADVEWISDWGNVDFGASFDNYYFGASPLEDPQLYIDKSPFFKLDRVTTPTIIYTGTEDRNVPPHQSWSLFRMMQQLGKAPVRLVLFPGEPHGLRKIVHRRRKLAEDLAWFDRYLFNVPDDSNGAIKEGSNLAALIDRSESTMVGALYGERAEGRLVPELVKHDGLLVGRFEVTCAQYAEFDADHECPGDGANAPVTGVTFDQARDYVRWLAELTGLPYRLPTASEATALTKSAGTGGNTLDAWAGYAPNPDDLSNLSEAIAALGGAAPLLREVGLGVGAGTPAIFDLDGNAAEWAVAEDEAGTLVGPSADRPAAKRNWIREADAAYRGLRVVIGDESDAGGN